MSRHPRCTILVDLPPLQVGDRVFRGPLSGGQPHGEDVISRVFEQHYLTVKGGRVFRRTDGTAADNGPFRIWPVVWGAGWRPGAA